MNDKLKIIALNSRINDLSAAKAEIDDSSADSLDSTYSAFKIEERISEIPSGGVEEAPIDTKQYGRKDAGWTEVIAGGHIDGGTANSVYLVSQNLDGGGA